MDTKQIEDLKKDIENILTTHENVVIEVNRTEPNSIWDKGYPEKVPSWIAQTITIKSTFYYVPDEVCH